MSSADLSAPAEDVAPTDVQGPNADLSPQDLTIDLEDGSAPEDAMPADGDPAGPVDGQPDGAEPPPDTAADTAAALVPPARAHVLTMTPNTCPLGSTAPRLLGGPARSTRVASSRVHGRIADDLGHPYRVAPWLGEAHRT